MSEDEDRSKPLSIDEIAKAEKTKPARSDEIPLPTGVGNSAGWGDKALGGFATYSDDDEDVPNNGVIGARIKRGN